MVDIAKIEELKQELVNLGVDIQLSRVRRLAARKLWLGRLIQWVRFKMACRRYEKMRALLHA